MKAAKELADLMPEIEKLKACGKTCKTFNKDCKDCQKKNASFEGVVQKAKALVKKYPSSPAAEQVKGLLPVE
jgi:hypothetical protein